MALSPVIPLTPSHITGFLTKGAHTYTHAHTHACIHTYIYTCTPIHTRLLSQVAAINTAMSSLVKTLNVFPRERLIVQRERAKHSYTTAPYLAAKLLAELPLGEGGRGVSNIY